MMTLTYDLYIMLAVSCSTALRLAIPGFKSYTLETLSHLSFILPRFGGVSSTASSALPELLKTFYTALDVLSTSADQSRALVRMLQKDVNSTRQRGTSIWVLVVPS